MDTWPASTSGKLWISSQLKAWPLFILLPYWGSGSIRLTGFCAPWELIRDTTPYAMRGRKSRNTSPCLPIKKFGKDSWCDRDWNQAKPCPLRPRMPSGLAMVRAWLYDWRNRSPHRTGLDSYFWDDDTRVKESIMKNMVSLVKMEL